MKISKRKRTNGFTLIELMIVVVIISIIAAFAYPSYRKSVLKTHRADAKTSLLETAQILERCFTTYSAYNNVACARVSAGPTISLTSNDGFYAISSIVGGAETLTATTYTLQATPTSTGKQTDDTDCAQFSLTYTGAKSATNTYCWE